MHACISVIHQNNSVFLLHRKDQLLTTSLRHNAFQNGPNMEKKKKEEERKLLIGGSLLRVVCVE